MVFESDNLNLKYTKHPQTGTIQILEETEERGSRTPMKKSKRREQNSYYPFGLKHEGYNPTHEIIEVGEPMGQVTIIPVTEDLGDPYKYKFNGKEYQDEFGLDWYDFGARNYQADLGRWMNVDPLSEAPANIGTSPYTYVWNNPLKFIDPDGRHGQTTIVGDNGNGTFTVKDWIDDGKTDVITEDGTKVGESLTTHSFVDENDNAVVGAVIDTNSTEGQDFIDNEIVGDNPNVFEYKDNATINEHYDFKSRGLDEKISEQEALVHRTRGSMTEDGKMASARDFGNMGAGIVAGRTGFPKWMIKREFNKLQGGPEPPVSAKAQDIGIKMGRKLFWSDFGKRALESPIKF